MGHSRQKRIHRVRNEVSGDPVRIKDFIHQRRTGAATQFRADEVFDTFVLARNHPFNRDFFHHFLPSFQSAFIINFLNWVRSM
jgi:hypothetical protein